MGNGKLTIDTAINTSGVEQGIKKVQKSLNAIKGAGMTAVITAETKALKELVKGIDETAKAYNNQLKAEKQLETAAKNNPYLNSQTVKQLKDFASELQSIGTVGDEQLLPLMAQLASTGRTQTEIQQILSAALDVSASGMMSLDSAVTQLNATFSGNIGLMGRQVPELKNLTAEELANGKAVEVMAKNYAGMAADVAAAAGSYEQMKNAQGDFKEALGAITKPTSDLWNNFWKGWYEKGIENVNKLNAQLSSFSNRASLEAIAFQYEDEASAIAEIDRQLDNLSTAELDNLVKYYKGLRKLNGIQAEIYGSAGATLTLREEATKKAEEQAKKEKLAAEEKAKAEKEAATAAKTRADYIKEYETQLADSLKNLELEAELNKEKVSDQDILNAKLAAYYSLVKNIGDDDPFSKEKLNELKNFANGISGNTDELKELKDALDAITDGNKIESLKTQLSELDKLAAGLDKASDLYAQYVEKRKLLEEQITQAQREEIANQVANVSEYFTKFNDITQDMTDLIRQNAEEQTTAEMGELSKQYTDGLISYEEYCDKKRELDKKQAQEEYKLKMWEWTSSLLTATANIAQGVSAALAQMPPASYIMAGLTATAGAIQLATLTANKPKAPSFATGGFLTGNSYSGDKIPFMGNAGEAILNPAEMRNFMDMANGNYSGGGNNIVMPVKIENNNGSNVSTQMNKNGLIVIIDDIVNSSMQAGKYTQSMNIAQSRSNGVSIY